MRTRFPWLVLLLIQSLVLPVSAFAQALNVNFRFSSGTDPSTSFGGASGQGGVWNAVNFPVSFALDDIDGNPTSVVLTAVDFSSFSGTAAAGDQELLLDSYAAVAPGVPWTVMLSGLQPGNYRLSVYAHSDPTPVPTGNLTIEGISLFNIPGEFSSTDPFGPDRGLSWNSIDVRVGDDGLLVIDSAGDGFERGLAGLQLVPLAHLGLNIDFGGASGEPSSAFGAAASQPGQWNEIGVGFSVLDGLGGAPSNASILVDTSSTGSGGSSSGSEGQLLSDYLFGSSNVGWRVDIAGLAPGTYDVFLYGPSNNTVGTGAMTIDDVVHPGLTGRSDSVLEQGVSWDVVRVALEDEALTLTGTGLITAIAGVQVVPSVRQSLNIDLGTAEGEPPSTYPAAAAFGHWTGVAVGPVTPLLDLAGKSSGVSLDVGAAGTSTIGAAISSDEDLLHDFIIAFGPYSVTLNGLSQGPYRVFVYAPSSASVETGPLTIEGVPVANLTGDPDSNLIEGVSWASVDISVGADGLLDVVGAGGPTVGLAGIQVVSLAPQPINVDLGEDYARSGDTYAAAAGQAGRWNEAPLDWTALRNVAGDVAGVGFFVFGESPGSGSGASDDDQAMLEDHIEAGTLGYFALVTGLAPGPYTLYLYAPSEFSLSTGDMQINNVPVGALSGVATSELIEGLSWLAVDVTIDDYAIIIDGPFGPPATGLAGVQVVPRFATALNIDLGANLGAPADTFGGALGQPGVWSAVSRSTGLNFDNGTSTLVDLSGVPSGASAFVFGDSGLDDNGQTPTIDEDRLLDDYLNGDGAAFWSVEIAGLAPGDYFVVPYGPYLSPSQTGTMTVGGVPLPLLPGDPNSALRLGVSYDAVQVTVTDTLSLAGVGTPTYGLAGLQVVPLPEPAAGASVASGAALIAWLARRRRTRWQREVARAGTGAAAPSQIMPPIALPTWRTSRLVIGEHASEDPNDLRVIRVRAAA